MTNFQPANIDQRPFALGQEPGIKDYAALYSPDENAAALLLSNAEIIVDQHTAQHVLVNINEKPEGTKKAWPPPDRIMTCTPAEQKLLEDGLRVGPAMRCVPESACSHRGRSPWR